MTPAARWPCTHCAGDHVVVLESRLTTRGKRRRRKCTACGHRTTTLEVELGHLEDVTERADAFREVVWLVDRLRPQVLPAIEPTPAQGGAQP